MKFEQINDTLCRMVEPEPLTDKSQFPCVVRLIQDETMLGKANIRACHPETLANKRICSELTDDGLFMDGNYTYRYEIIGYPVDDGSAEWALYQMMQGKWVYNPSLEKHKSDKLDTRYLHAYGKFGQDVVVKNTITGEDSILGAANINHWFNYADPTGWQLYEPKPAYKVGDWVEVSGHGRTIHGKCISTEGTVSEPSNMIRACGYLFNPDGTDAKYRCKTHGYLITRKLSPSEVVIRIGCLSGTVTHAMSDDCFLLAKVNDPQYRVCCIDMSMLDTTTRNFVEELLKAQEESCHS